MGKEIKICCKRFGSDTKNTISMLAQRIATKTRLANNSGLLDVGEPMSVSDTAAAVNAPQTQRITSEMDLAKTTSLDERLNKTLYDVLSARNKNKQSLLNEII